MRHASSHNHRNSSFIVYMAMGQIPRSTEGISSLLFSIIIIITNEYYYCSVVSYEKLREHLANYYFIHFW